MAQKELETSVQHAFRSDSVIADTNLMRMKQEPKPTQTQQSNAPMSVLESELKFNDVELFNKLIGDKIKINQSWTPAERTEEVLRQLFTLIKANLGPTVDPATIGIRYDAHSWTDEQTGEKHERKLQTPDEVLKSKIADCGELSWLLVASARQLGMDMSEIRMALMSCNVKYKDETRPEERHMALITVGMDNYLIDPSCGFFKKLTLLLQPADLGFDAMVQSQIERSYTDSTSDTIYRKSGVSSGLVIQGITNLRIGSISELIAENLVERASFCLFSKKEDLEGALLPLEHAHELDPSDTLAVHNLLFICTSWGNAAADQGRYAEAVSDYQNASALKPDDGDFHTLIAQTLCKEADMELAGKQPEAAKAHLEAALKEYEQAAALTPNLASYQNVFVVSRRLGNFPEAHEFLEKMLGLQPDAVSVLRDGMALAKDEKDFPSCLTFSTALRKQAPRDAEAWFNESYAALKLGKAAFNDSPPNRILAKTYFDEAREATNEALKFEKDQTLRRDLINNLKLINQYLEQLRKNP